MDEKKLIELLHDATALLSSFERADTKDLEREIDDVLLESPHVSEDDKEAIRGYWEEARDE